MSLEEHIRQEKEKKALRELAVLNRQTNEKLDSLERALNNMTKDAPLREAVEALGKDMHVVSTRPCATCQVLSNLLGKPFGCIAHAKRVVLSKPLKPEEK